METNRKIIGNAISSYLLIFISISFLFIKGNKYISNNFVKTHTKTAFLIHILFLITYILFNTYAIGSSIHFLWFALNTILASSFFIILFALLMYGIYNANKGVNFTIVELLSLTKTENIMQIDTEKKLSEKDKFSIIISHIPFIWFFTYGRHLANTHIKNIVRVNLLISSIIAFFYVIWWNNIATLLTLFYIVYVVFASITLIVKEEIISINTKIIPMPSEKYIWIKTFFSYIGRYLKNKDFKNISVLYNEKKTAYYAAEKQRFEETKIHKNTFFSPYLIYIPIINFVFLFSKNTKYKYHIVNGITLSLVTIALVIFFWIRSFTPIIVLFPITFGLWFLPRLGYQMPYIYNFYAFFANIWNKIKSIFIKGRKIQKTQKTVNMKVWIDTKNSDSKKIK